MVRELCDAADRFCEGGIRFMYNARAEVRERSMAEASLPRGLLEEFLPGSGTLRKVMLVVAGSGIVALTAQIAIPLPFTAVPVTGQTFGVLLVGALLGARGGAAALLLYLMEGAAGLPVFAPFGTPGATRFLGPTAGYLIAFPLAAWIVGWAVERGWYQPGRGRGARLVASLLLAEGFIFIFGCAWLGMWSHQGAAEAIRLGLYPFLPGELFKMVILAGALEAAGWGTSRRR